MPAQVSLTPIGSEYGWIGASEVYWVDQMRHAWSANITTRNGLLEVSTPKPLFGEVPLEKRAAVLAPDPARERFLISVADGEPEQSQLIIVSDWRAEMLRAQPARR